MHGSTGGFQREGVWRMTTMMMDRTVMGMNGMMVCCCNLTMGMCKCEMTGDGCVVTCTSGDPKCCDMIQACCDCMAAMMKAGCTCCLMMNGTPVCCGSPEVATPKASKK